MGFELGLMNKSEAKDVIVKNHYTRKWTSCRYALGLWNDQNENVGVCVYGYPIGRRVAQSITPDMTKNDVLELTRLWTNDDLPKNTESWFLGRTFEWLRTNSTAKVLIAYSDPLYDHVGYIYQATNWLYQGNNTMKVKGYLHYVNGEYLHPRNCVSKYGTIKTEELKKIDPDYKRFPLKKKHRYIYILHKADRKRIRKRLKHPVLPYPKTNEDCDF